MHHYYYPTNFHYEPHRDMFIPHEQDQRFFPFLLPFVAGLAVGPLLFNRPLYPPYPPVVSPYPVYGGYPTFTQPYSIQPIPITETINIYQ